MCLVSGLVAAANIIFTLIMRYGTLYYVQWDDPLVLSVYVMWLAETVLLIGKVPHSLVGF